MRRPPSLTNHRGAAVISRTGECQYCLFAGTAHRPNEVMVRLRWWGRISVGCVHATPSTAAAVHRSGTVADGAVVVSTVSTRPEEILAAVCA